MNIEPKLNKLSVTEPYVMTHRPKVDVFATPLNREQLQSAKKALVKHDFPVQRLLRKDPALGNQYIALHSFIPSANAVPDPDGVYGVIKFRGTFPNEREADEWSERLIKDVSTYDEIWMTKVGEEFPLTADADKYCLETREIDFRDKLNKIAKEDLKKKRQTEVEEMKEMSQRTEKLKADVKEDKENATDDLEFYTQMQVKRASLLARVDEAKKTISESEKILAQTSQEIRQLDVMHPKYKHQYKDQYNKALDESGINPADNPLAKYFPK